MKFCLTCRELSPGRDEGGESLYCPRCGLSFGVRRCRTCKKRPPSPRDANYCVHCGGDSLSDGTAYVELGWLVRLLSLAVGLLAVRGVWSAMGAGRPVSGPGGHAVGMAQNAVMAVVGFCLYWAVLLGAVSLCLSIVPGELGKQIRGLYSKALTAGLKAARWAFGQALVWLRELFGARKT